MQERLKGLLVYMAKCATGALLVFLLSHLTNYHDISWCLISVMLVLSPDGKDAVTLAVTRIKANLVGAGVGVLSMLVIAPNMWSISIAIAITVALCDILKVATGTRSALAATIIIMLHEEGKHLWDTALERIIAVLAGCTLALTITFLFHLNIKPDSKQQNHDEQEA